MRLRPAINIIVTIGVVIWAVSVPLGGGFIARVLSIELWQLVVVP